MIRFFAAILFAAIIAFPACAEVFPVEKGVTFPDREIKLGSTMLMNIPVLPQVEGKIIVLRADILAPSSRRGGSNFLTDVMLNGTILKMERSDGSSRIINRDPAFVLRNSGLKPGKLYSPGGKLQIVSAPNFDEGDNMTGDRKGTQFVIDITDAMREGKTNQIQIRNVGARNGLSVRNVAVGYALAPATNPTTTPTVAPATNPTTTPTVAPAAASATNPAVKNCNIVNVRDFGAVGDGVADDTAAIQKAIDAAQDPGGGGLFIPAGKYRITSTLFLRKTRIMYIYGQGDSVYNAKSNRSSTLFWDGPADGTLIKAEGFGNVYFERLNLAGRAENKPKSAGEAGILFHSISLPGYGSGWSTFRNVSLHKAKIGFVMGGDDSVDMCNSDMQFYSIGMYELETGFQTRNTQALNFIFNYINAANCGTVLDFKAGGNLEVHNATLSVCDRYLNIEMGGRCIGTYLNNNIRLENRSKQRTVLVRSYPSYCQANIKFINFDDSQVGWPQNTTPTRSIPLCDIGPGSCVTIESSLFNGVVAKINGTADAPASLILRECSFGWILPENAISANEYGYFQVINPMNDHMRPLPDLRKWPALTPKTFPANGTHQAVF